MMQALTPLCALAILNLLWFERSASTLLVSSVLAIQFVIQLREIARGPVTSSRHAWILVVFLMICSLVSYSQVGFLSGPTAGLLVAIMMAGLLLSFRAMIAVIAIAFLGISAVGWGIVSGLLPAPTTSDISMLSGRVWIRTTITTFILIVLAVILVRRLVLELEGALARAEVQASERERANQERLRTQQRALEAQKLEALGTLAASVAHDFNNSLMIVQMWNDILERSEVTPAQRREGSAAIAQAVDGAAALSRQLLMFARKEPRAPKRLSLAGTVNTFKRSLGKLLPSDIELVAQADGDTPIRADPLQIDQVLLNLSINARDAMPRGGRLELRAREVQLTEDVSAVNGLLAPGDYSVLEVTDSGTGMSSETVARVFEPFFTTKESGKGTGLGLATVMAVAEQSGARIRLETALGRGTSIGLWFPADRSVAGEEQVRPVETPKARSMCVLLAEDNRLLRNTLERALVEGGYRVITAGDVPDAQKIVGENRGAIDLLCTDGVMPGAPVSDLIRTFQENCPQGRVLIMSGYVDDELARRGLESGRYNFISKPVGLEELLLAVAQTTTRPSDFSARLA
ncbi:MAG: ATP-binding protein [Myxococcales bacterium]